MFSLFFSNITGLLDVRFEIKSMGATAFEGVSKCALRSSHGMFVIEWAHIKYQQLDIIFWRNSVILQSCITGYFATWLISVTNIHVRNVSWFPKRISDSSKMRIESVDLTVESSQFQWWSSWALKLIPCS